MRLTAQVTFEAGKKSCGWSCRFMRANICEFENDRHRLLNFHRKWQKYMRTAYCLEEAKPVDDTPRNSTQLNARMTGKTQKKSAAELMKAGGRTNPLEGRPFHLGKPAEDA